MVNYKYTGVAHTISLDGEEYDYNMLTSFDCKWQGNLESDFPGGINIIKFTAPPEPVDEPMDEPVDEPVDEPISE